MTTSAVLLAFLLGAAPSVLPPDALPSRSSHSPPEPSGRAPGSSEVETDRMPEVTGVQLDARAAALLSGQPRPSVRGRGVPSKALEGGAGSRSEALRTRRPEPGTATATDESRTPRRSKESAARPAPRRVASPPSIHPLVALVSAVAASADDRPPLPGR